MPGHPRFHPLVPPDDAEVARLAGGVARRIASLFERRGLGPDADPGEVDSLTNLQPGLASLYGASVAGRIATGPDAGRRVSIAGVRIDEEPRQLLTGPRCATVSGFSLHANIAIPAHDRPRLERICRDAARPPLAIEHLSERLDGRLAYRLKRPWKPLIVGTAPERRAAGALHARSCRCTPAPRPRCGLATTPSSTWGSAHASRVRD